jgi:hypothetical protein
MILIFALYDSQTCFDILREGHEVEVFGGISGSKRIEVTLPDVERTNVWIKKLIKNMIENHTNELTVNIQDNSGNTDRMKRYTDLTLPDIPE